MFLNFINQYGIFFGLLIGVIVGLVAAYLLFSRSKNDAEHEISIKEVESEDSSDDLDSNEIENEQTIIEQLALEAEQKAKRIEDEKLLIESFCEHTLVDETAEKIKNAPISNLNDISSKSPDTSDEVEKDKPTKKTSSTKPKQKTPVVPPKEKKEMGRYHVLFRKEDALWYVKREGNDRIVKVLHTQKEAIAFATIKAITHKTSIVIHKRDGKIRKQMY